MRKMIAAVPVAALVFALATPAAAQSGHFIERTVSCTDIGTQVECTGKVAGLGGTTFTIVVEADGIASVSCTNPGGNVAPGQNTSVTTEGSSGPMPTPKNGQYVFPSITTDDPEPLPPTPTCPNDQWTADVVDVSFTTATLSLYEDSTLSDQITVPVN
jgi:hypothetical protein